MGKPKKKKVIEEEEELYPSEEQGILPEEHGESLKLAMEHGAEDESIDEPEGREKLLEDDEMEPWEEGFAEGADEEGQLAKDALTGEPLGEFDEVVETEIDGRVYRFVSKKNAEKFRRKKELEEIE